MNITEKLKQIVAAQLRIEADSIDTNVDVIDDLGADSLDIVEILMVLEEQFGITIPDEEVTGLRTVAEMQAYIESKI